MLQKPEDFAGENKSIDAAGVSFSTVEKQRSKPQSKMCGRPEAEIDNRGRRQYNTVL